MAPRLSLSLSRSCFVRERKRIFRVLSFELMYFPAVGTGMAGRKREYQASVGSPPGGTCLLLCTRDFRPRRNEFAAAVLLGSRSSATRKETARSPDTRDSASAIFHRKNFSSRELRPVKIASGTSRRSETDTLCTPTPGAPSCFACSYFLFYFFHSSTFYT